MTDLRNNTLTNLPASVRIPDYDRSRLRPGIAHIGVGNFHRAHQAPVIEKCLRVPQNDCWAISGIGLLNNPVSRAKAAAFLAQDNLYTVTQLHSDLSTSTQVIGAMVEYLYAPEAAQAVLARLAHPDTRIVSLTITEGGYNISETTGLFQLDQPDIVHDLSNPTPITAFGFIVAALKTRRANGLKPFTVVSCDNLRSNGDTTRRAVVSFARAISADLADWIEENGAFPNSMVDRIAPQVSAEDRNRLNAASGVNDLIPASCEEYTNWVIEDQFCAGRPELELGGVEFSTEVTGHEAVKGRLSNAAHMMMCYPSLLMGHRFVHEGMAEPRIVHLLKSFWQRDVIPLISPPTSVSVTAFTKGVLVRFANPAIRDQLLRVAHDGAAKIVVFHSRTITELISRGGDLTREAFLFASFARYLRGLDDLGKPFPVNEPQFTEADWKLLRSEEPLGLLQTSPFRALALAGVPTFRKLYVRMFQSQAERGVGATLETILV
ncbi:MAG: mannitol dehydrogenase family protein [Verrucomicrobia bacterium]|nr:mannitol dehydrogenase family protein [Verrucomicrobiota bacterium]MBV8640207.1 mannitol dehydrogenase family protein [Verrucomicrobiota bacterium]